MFLYQNDIVQRGHKGGIMISNGQTGDAIRSSYHASGLHGSHSFGDHTFLINIHLHIYSINNMYLNGPKFMHERMIHLSSCQLATFFILCHYSFSVNRLININWLKGWHFLICLWLPLNSGIFKIDQWSTKVINFLPILILINFVCT